MAPTAWVIRGGEGNRLVDTFVDDGVTAVGYPTIGDGRSVPTVDVRAQLRRERVAGVDGAVARFDSFVNEIRVGDVVLMPDTPRGEIVIGIVQGDYDYRDDVPVDRYRHRRDVRWVGRHGTNELPTARQDLYKQRTTLRRYDAPDLVAHAALVEAGGVGRPATDRNAVRHRPSGTASSPSKTYVPRERRCEGCGYQKSLTQFAGESLCPDCR